MTKQDYTVTISVSRSPEEVFDAINKVRGWWSQEIEGDTDRLGAEFEYRYQDIHRARFKIAELTPGKRIVWHVLDNYFSFVKDKSEWKGTDVVFDIARKGDKTELRFTHVGLGPTYECYDVCSDAWGLYIRGSLHDLIMTGHGEPNPLEKVVSKARSMAGRDYTTTFTVDQTPDEVFQAINNARAWWSGKIVGRTDKLGAEFTYSYKDMHHSTHKITEFVPGKKVVWHTVAASINFVQDKAEWNGTDIVFEIAMKGKKTELRFTHVGLVPAIECYGGCSGAWGSYINGALRDLIVKGKRRNKKAA